MAKAFLTSLFFVISFISFAQNSDISILITDSKTNEPLLGATIYFEELEKGLLSCRFVGS